MERDESIESSTYDEDALGVPEHTTSTPERESVPPDEQMPPGEHPRGADAWGTTAAEQRAGRPLGDRLDAEVPERSPAPEPDGVRLVDDGQPDETPELTSTDEPAVAEDASAEEAAVHLRQDAPGGTSGRDTYVDGSVDDGRGATP